MSGMIKKNTVLQKLASIDGASKIGFNPINGDEFTNAEARMREHDATTDYLNENLKIEFLPLVTTPANDLDEIPVSQNGEKKKIQFGQIRAEAALGAESAKIAAEEAQEKAEAARDAAFVSANVYATVAAGLAAVADGVQFQVVSIDGVTITRYRRDSAVIASQVASYPAGTILLSGYQKSGYAYVIVDQEGNIAAGARPDGSFAIGAEEDVGAAIPGARVATATQTMRPAGDGYNIAVVDDDDNMAFAVLSDGTVLVGDDETAPKTQADETTAAVIGTTRIVAWGDSLTEGSGSSSGQTYPVQLAALIGLSVLNEGFGGQTAKQIMCRQGGSAAMVTVSGNTIPASGAVAVTLDVSLLAYPAAQAFSITGTLFGIPGVLTKDTINNYTFTRSTAGSATKVPPAAPFVVTQSTRNTSGVNYDQGINLFWCGSNDVGTAGIAGVIDQLANGISKIQQSEKRFMILGPLAGSSVTQATQAYIDMQAAVNAIKQRWPRNFIDVHGLLLENYNPAITQDVTDYANKVTPYSLRADTIHLNNAGYAIVAQAVAQHLTAKGWLS